VYWGHGLRAFMDPSIPEEEGEGAQEGDEWAQEDEGAQSAPPSEATHAESLLPR
jgi:hypothetical protein